MSPLARRISARVVLLAGLLTGSLVAVCLAGATGLERTSDLADSIYADHLATTGVTANVGRELSDIYRTAATVAVATDPDVVSGLTIRLYDSVPDFEVALDRLVAAHSSDAATEQDAIAAFRQGWQQTRSGVVSDLTVHETRRTTTEAAVTTAFDPLMQMVQNLIERERRDAENARAAARAVYTSSKRTIYLITGLAGLLATISLMLLVRRVIPRALRREEDQAHFGEAIALAEDEDDAHDFLRRHLDRVVAGSTTVVLRRNNSANRLEAVGQVADGVGPPVRLDHAEPRSCIAVRTARPHVQHGGTELLMTCRVCGDCPGATLCNPLTVGGEVIGAVLVNARHLDPDDERRVRETVAQAAPVLANLRNLAVAEFRAATDSLTGLPNRRALTDTTRRMVAQAARSGSELSLLSLDLDHFKHINDQFGHPVGDQVLAAVGAALRDSLRASDYAGRHGGEEFLVLLPDTTLAGAIEVADKIHRTIGEIMIAALGRRITASIGIAVYPTHAGDVEALERGADRALYDAKTAGRDRTEVCSLAAPTSFTSPVLVDSVARSAPGA